MAQPQTLYFMKSSVLQRADTLLAMIRQEASNLEDENARIWVDVFRTENVSGYQLRNEALDRVCCITGNRKGDGYRVIFGSAEHFAFESGAPLDTAGFAIYRYDDVYRAAVFVLNYLTGKVS